MPRSHTLLFGLILACAALFVVNTCAAQENSAKQWSFAVSGDSRDCGDIVMPAIAAGAKKDGASFYWHLGDLRKIYDFDEDIQHEPQHPGQPLSIIEYERLAWPDFISHEIDSFSPMGFFLGIGNHDVIPPMSRDLFIQQFDDWLNQPVLREQRLRDNPHNHKIQTYFHWQKGGVDFVNLDNASSDQFDRAQMGWFEGVLKRDESDSEIRTIVVGMHRALPESISYGHSMNESAQGTESGRRAYTDLLAAQNQSHKRVYILASHSHYYMANIFNTDYWRTHGGILPGWIVGTAGAVRYALPPDAENASAAETNVYGYLLGAVEPDGEIRFAFHKLEKSDVPADVVQAFTPNFVGWCFEHNSEAGTPMSKH